MTKITPSSVTSDPSLDKKHDYSLRSGITASKDTKRVLSPDNIRSPPKSIQEEWHEPRLYVRQKEEEKERRDQMKELDYHKLIASQTVANNKIYDIKEEQENIKKEVPMFESLM